MVTGLWNTCGRGTRGLNIREGGSPEITVKKTTIKGRSMHDRCTLFGWSVCILLLRLASFGATPRPLSGLRGRSGLGLPSGGWALGHGGTRRGGTSIDSGVRTFIGVNFAHGRIGDNDLLVHKSGGKYIDQHTRRTAEVRERETADSRLRSSSVS
jgi:hypothetical protein